MKQQGCGSRQEAHQPSSMTEVFRLLDLVAKKLRQIQSRTVQETRLTPPQFFILTLLWERDGRPLKELSAASHSSPPTTTGLVDTLEKNALVTRELNPDDRRSFLVKLTAKGKSLQHATPSLDRIFQSCCGGLEPDELERLGQLLKKLDDSLQF